MPGNGIIGSKDTHIKKYLRILSIAFQESYFSTSFPSLDRINLFNFLLFSFLACISSIIIEVDHFCMSTDHLYFFSGFPFTFVCPFFKFLLIYRSTLCALEINHLSVTYPINHSSQSITQFSTWNLWYWKLFFIKSKIAIFIFFDFFVDFVYCLIMGTKYNYTW